MATIQLTPAHGWVGLTAVGSIFVGQYMAGQVMGARKKYEVKYPALYAEKDNPKAKEFNCYQRGHQNFIENVPTFLTLLAISGAYYPIASSVAGGVWLAGRVAYFNGYASGDPQKRKNGLFQYAGLVALLGCAVTGCVRTVLGK